MSAVKTLAHIANFFSQHCGLEEGRGLTCSRCRGEIRRIRAYMALHDERFGDACSGPDRAWRIDIPYCIACEEPPSRYGCIHMSEAELNLPSVVEASRPFGAGFSGQ